MFGVGVQVFDAAAQLEEVEHGITGAFGGGTGGKWAEAAIRRATDVTVRREEPGKVVF
jgi:hypothetical protein